MHAKPHPNKNEERTTMKQVNIREQTHQLVKVLAAETGRRIHGDLIDDLVMLGIEDFRRNQKNFKDRVTSAGYKPATAKAAAHAS